MLRRFWQNQRLAFWHLRTLLVECLSEQTFVVDNGRHYPLSFDVEILKQACPDLDGFKTDFVIDGYRRECASAVVDHINNNDLKQEIYNKSPSPPPPTKPVEVANQKTNNKSNAKEPPPTRDLELEVKVVLDCFDGLDGLCETCPQCRGGNISGTREQSTTRSSCC
ncbi:uncharacterized protein [Musca autumnalis]|uniref:uncharacterized protein n=1 Tax=Musca autumnalis TaxID=221902 RepID=UPI003CF0931C